MRRVELRGEESLLPPFAHARARIPREFDQTFREIPVQTTIHHRHVRGRRRVRFRQRRRRRLARFSLALPARPNRRGARGRRPRAESARGKHERALFFVRRRGGVRGGVLAGVLAGAPSPAPRSSLRPPSRPSSSTDEDASVSVTSSRVTCPTDEPCRRCPAVPKDWLRDGGGPSRACRLAHDAADWKKRVRPRDATQRRRRSARTSGDASETAGTIAIATARSAATRSSASNPVMFSRAWWSSPSRSAPASRRSASGTRTSAPSAKTAAARTSGVGCARRDATDSTARAAIASACISELFSQSLPTHRQSQRTKSGEPPGLAAAGRWFRQMWSKPELAHTA